jgi:acetylornithine/N-succinyldiaminopimelate aminotransferase
MSIAQQEAEFFFPTYKRLSLEIVRGEGCSLYTKDGAKYVDMFAGLAVNALGYNHPQIIAAIEEQARKYIHLSNYFIQEPQVLLAEKLLHHSGYKKIFFTNSGTEANEGAIKLVRKWSNGTGKTKIYGMTNGFSGRTMGSLSLMDKQNYREGYGPFLPDFDHIIFNDLVDLNKKVNGSTAAVFLECIQGEGGVVPVSKEFVSALKELHGKFGFILVADEIQSGAWRTGKIFSFKHFGIEPDIVTMAKPIGGGLPLGAILGNDKLANTWSYGVHGTTFGGNPVACAAGNVVIDILSSREMINHVKEISAYLHENLDSLSKKHSNVIKEIRGLGLMIGIDLHINSGPVVEAMLGRGVLANSTAGTVVRILPPLIVSRKEIDQFLNVFSDVLTG